MGWIGLIANSDSTPTELQIYDTYLAILNTEKLNLFTSPYTFAIGNHNKRKPTRSHHMTACCQQSRVQRRTNPSQQADDPSEIPRTRQHTAWVFPIPRTACSWRRGLIWHPSLQITCSLLAAPYIISRGLTDSQRGNRLVTTAVGRRIIGTSWMQWLSQCDYGNLAANNLPPPHYVVVGGKWRAIVSEEGGVGLGFKPH